MIMVDKNSFDATQNAATAAREAADGARDNVGRGVDAAREYASRGYGAARDYANEGYDAACEYASAGLDVAARRMRDLTDFVQNEPWIAIAAAFAVGYVTARIMRRFYQSSADSKESMGTD
jgi:hypothetical protein